MNRTSSRRFRGRRACAAAAALSFALIAVPSTEAANVFWNVSGGGAWDTTSNNWIGGSPVATQYRNGDNASFANPAGGTITIASGISPASTVVNSTGVYTFAGEGLNGLTGTLTKSSTGRLTLSNTSSNAFAAVTVENGGSIAAMGSNAHLTLNVTGGLAMFGDLNIGIPTAVSGNVAKVSLNQSSQLAQTSRVNFNSSVGRYAYFSMRGHFQALRGIISNADGGAIENGNFNGAINTDGQLLILPLAGDVYTFSGIIRDADAGGGTGKLNFAVGTPPGNAGGTQVLAGAASNYTWTGATAVTGSTLRLETSLTGSSNVNVTDNGKLVLASGGGSNRVIKAPGLAITDNGKLDLRDNKLITNVGSGVPTAGVYDGVQGFVQRAHHGGAWDGAGLATSMPDAVAGLTSIGVANAGNARSIGVGQTALFAGQTVTATQTLAMYTYAGDANLDGQVTGDDYSGIDFSILTPGSSGWFGGDFNYDGVVTGDDYSAIDFNILAQGAPFPTGAAADNVTAVPEPSSLAIGLTLASAGAVFRRRCASIDGEGLSRGTASPSR